MIWKDVVSDLVSPRYRSPVPHEQDGVVRSRTSRRTVVAGLGVALMFLGLTAKAGTIMLVPDAYLESKARLQFEQAVVVHGKRGDILARDGTTLATTVELLNVHADPWRLEQQRSEEGGPSAAEIAQALAPFLEVPVDELQRRLESSDRRDVLLARGLTPEQAEEVRSLANRSVLWTREEARRFYPARDDAAPLLGVAGRSGTGLAGLERTLDQQLRGQTYKYVLWRDRKGRTVTPNTPEARPGDSVTLTLDRQIQRVAEAALRAAVETTSAQAGHVVVMDVATGEILAMANWPTLNPNDTASLKLEQFKNRAALDAFEPGSVMKPFIAASAIEEGLVTPETLVDCEGGAWRVGNKTITDEHEAGIVPVSDVIKHSSNIGAAKLAFKLGGDKTISYLKNFGYSRYTGLDLPGETRGVMRDPKTIKPIELATTAYGHGVSVSAIQITAAMATLGNGGLRMQPMLVKEIRDHNGDLIEAFEPEVDRRVISEETARQTVVMMEGVTEQDGTARRASIKGYRTAGKTGTAWKHVGTGYSNTERIATFSGLVPADDPKVAITVVIDTPDWAHRFGGVAAAPVFSQVGASIMRQLGVPPNAELLAQQKGAPAQAEPDDEPAPELEIAEPELAWAEGANLRVPELTGMSLRDALVTLQGAGLGVALSGSGRVASQFPEPGESTAPGQTIKVVLQ